MQVMLATPAHDFRADVYYFNSVLETVRLCSGKGVQVHPVFWPGEALVQHARNALVQLALDAGVDQVLMIDSDQEWRAEQALALLRYPVDVVGAAVRKKTDAEEKYNVLAKSPYMQEDDKTGLWVVEAVGTGFLRVSVKALRAVWERATEYDHNGKKFRMIFEPLVVDGRLVGEDTIFCHKLHAAGFPVHVDPSFTVTHNGMKQYKGDFRAYVARLQAAIAPTAPEVTSPSPNSFQVGY